MISFRSQRHTYPTDSPSTCMKKTAPLGACACLNQMKNKRMTDGIMCWVIYRQAAGAKHTFLPPLHYNAITAVIIIFGLLIVCVFYPQFEWKMVRSTFAVHYNQQDQRCGKAYICWKFSSDICPCAPMIGECINLTERSRICGLLKIKQRLKPMSACVSILMLLNQTESTWTDFNSSL